MSESRRKRAIAARSRRALRRDAGLTLLEVLAAVTIVALALLALQAVMARNIDRAVISNDERMVKVLLKQKVEELRTGIETEENGTFAEDGFPQYAWTSQRTDRQITETEAVIELTVTVRYSDAAASGGFADAGFEDESAPEPIEATVRVLIDPPGASGPGAGAGS